MKVIMKIEVDLVENLINPKDEEERDWLFNTILTEGNLFIHDNEIGDTIGVVSRVIRCEETIIKELQNENAELREQIQIRDNLRQKQVCSKWDSKECRELDCMRYDCRDWRAELKGLDQITKTK